MKHSDEYFTHHAEKFEEFKRLSASTISVLDFLNGKPWDDLALAYVHALRPSTIRVTEGVVTADSYSWRVTVYVDKENIIENIEQEVRIGLPENVAHGEALNAALKYGIDSPQCKWYLDADGFLSSSEGYFKRVNGEWIEFPKPEEDAFDDAGKVIK